MHPSIAQVTLFVVWIRYTVMTAEILNAIDDYLPGTHCEDIQHQVDRFCATMEDLVSEWNLRSMMTDTSKGIVLRYLVADHVSTRSVTRGRHL